MKGSLGTMENVMQATTQSLQTQLLQGAGDLAQALAQFDESLIMEPENFKEVGQAGRLRSDLQQKNNEKNNVNNDKQNLRK